MFKLISLFLIISLDYKKGFGAISNDKINTQNDETKQTGLHIFPISIFFFSSTPWQFTLKI